MLRLFSILNTIVGIIIAILLYLGTSLPAPGSNDIQNIPVINHLDDTTYQSLYEKRFKIVLFAIPSQVLILNIIPLLFGFRHLRPKKYLKFELQTLIKRDFQDGGGSVRGTIFRREHGSITLLKHLFMIVRKIKNSTFLDWPKPWCQYLVIYTRAGQPYQGNSTTFFLIVDDEDEIDGFTSYVFYEDTIKSEVLPDIGGINFKKVANFEDIPEERNKNVKEYMKKGHISFKKLQKLNRKSKALWASPIHDKNENKWGVVIFDLNLEDSEAKIIEFAEKLVDFSQSLNNFIKTQL